jgi:hypothetical protein
MVLLWDAGRGNQAPYGIIQNPELNGRSPTEHVTVDTGEISVYTDMEWYVWVEYTLTTTEKPSLAGGWASLRPTAVVMSLDPASILLAHREIHRVDDAIVI